MSELSDEEIADLSDRAGLTEEETRRVVDGMVRVERETQRILNQPLTRLRGGLRRNWQAHGTICSALGTAFCPNCGSGHGQLVWTCCGTTEEEAAGLSTERYQQAVDADEIADLPAVFDEELRAAAFAESRAGDTDEGNPGQEGDARD